MPAGPTGPAGPSGMVGVAGGTSWYSYATTPPPDGQTYYLITGQLPANLHLNYVVLVTTRDPNDHGFCTLATYGPTVTEPWLRQYTTIQEFEANIPHANDPTDETQQILLDKPSPLAIGCSTNSQPTGYSLSVVRARTAGNTVEF